MATAREPGAEKELDARPLHGSVGAHAWDELSEEEARKLAGAVLDRDAASRLPDDPGGDGTRRRP